MVENVLIDIARCLDERFAAFFQQSSPARGWYANCPMPGDRAAVYQQWHAAGFWNYPFAEVPFADTWLFFERLAGGRSHVLDGQRGSTFHTWCEPAILLPADIDRIPAKVTGLPLWQVYETAVLAARGLLPIPLMAFTPLDWACSLCGTERFFLLMLDDAGTAEALLDRLTALYLSCCRRLQTLKIASRMPFGFPGIYVNDLQMPYLSPAHVARFVLPQYERVADEFGPMLLSLNCADVGVMRRVLAMEGVIGCAFDKRLPLPVITEHLGSKLFVISNYIYHRDFDRPTLHRGTYCNPIVQTYSEEIEKVCRVIGPGHRLLIILERHSFAEVCAARSRLESVGDCPSLS